MLFLNTYSFPTGAKKEQLRRDLREGTKLRDPLIIERKLADFTDYGLREKDGDLTAARTVLDTEKTRIGEATIL